MCHFISNLQSRRCCDYILYSSVKIVGSLGWQPEPCVQSVWFSVLIQSQGTTILCNNGKITKWILFDLKGQTLDNTFMIIFIGNMLF